MDKKSSTRQQATPPERPARTFDEDQMQRYSRHIVLPEIGGIGQRSLLDGKVLIVGAGGLGSPLVLYLAAAGVGRLGIVDSDVVELSNLQRQVVHRTADVGRAKAEVAAEAARLLNPDVVAMPYAERLTSANALGVIAGYDVVVDASDNFPTRYLVNDACVLLGKPDVFGSVYRFEGQATVFDARRGPCYRCLYPAPPPPDLVPSCAEAGVLGVLPGLIGVIQATEAMKLLLGIGEPLVGRLLLFDAQAMAFRELRLRRNPTCDLCSPTATQTGLIDYAAFCGGEDAAGDSLPDDVPEISATELAAALGGPDPPRLVDVRDPPEWEIGLLPGATRIPRAALVERLGELTSAPRLVLYCSSGARSAQAARWLRELGVTNVRSLRDGLRGWAREVDPSWPSY